MASLQAWIAEHKLASIGAFWASTVGASFAYNAKRTPLKTSLRLIHARMHAQALTLAVLSSAAALHYYSDTNHANTDIRGSSNGNAEDARSSSLLEEERLSWWF